MRAWLKEKWETAESWLPWFLGIASALILVVGLAVGFLRDDNTPRKPAAFVELPDPEYPSGESSGDASVQGGVVRLGKPKSSKSNSANSAGAPAFIVVVNDGRPGEAVRKEIQEKTGIAAVRAQAVVLVPENLLSAPGRAKQMDLALFPDLVIPVELKPASDYEVNEGIRTGVARGDSSSQVRLITQDGMVTGFITYQGKQYRIVADPNRGVHYVVEVR